MTDWAQVDFVNKTLDRFMQQLRDASMEECRRVAQAALTKPGLESPLEAAFAAAWNMYTVSACADRFSPFHLAPQVQVDWYRIDFVVKVMTSVGFPNPYWNRFPKLAIELDGHEFHEKSKEQVTRQNERERYLIGEGWKLLHYSGSEFYRDPFKCVSDAHHHAHNALMKLVCADRDDTWARYDEMLESWRQQARA